MRAAVIPCSARKLDRSARVEELYTGPLFRSALLTAQALKRDGVVDRVLVLSARHGLVTLDTVLEPYDLKLEAGVGVTADELARHLTELHADLELVELLPLLPREYDARLRAAVELLWPPLVEVVDNPLTGSRGLLEQRGRLRRIREDVTA